MSVTELEVPAVGMVATVRQRRGVISSVEPFDDGPDGRYHLVTVEYMDANGPPEDQLVWEIEARVGARLLLPTALPDVMGDPAMRPDEFDALVRATRWTALTPFIDPDDDGPLDRLPICAPLHGAVQIEDFQLVPLLKALRMPRVTLLLADDVGLGKTVEAGLILRELLVRRRLRRILILCPAALRLQWRDEMQSKFSMAFDVVDRKRTHELQRSMGMDANPWRAFPRIITSYHYLKQHDVLQEFLSVSRVRDDSPHLPWDMIILDEAHNLSPSSFGTDSDLSAMLGSVAPLFEHRLFLTATPHNGHTRSFSGLLERLDPVRFSRTTEFSPAERVRVEDVVIRRLKREINVRTDPPRFCDRAPKGVQIDLALDEKRLSSAVATFRKKVRSVIAARSRTEQTAGAFAAEVLSKRLLSCPYTFAESWHRYLEGAAQDEVADAREVDAARKKVEEDTGDDRESESRQAHAAHTVGAWLKPLLADIESEAADVNATLRRLGLQDAAGQATGKYPKKDSRFAALQSLVENRLRDGGEWRDDERIVIFTEYKTTLDYVAERLRETFGGENRVLLLYGGMGDTEREDIKSAFNDPTDPVRVLVATDAASEGLNLQETARYLLHYDVPWNPSRLEQRNGRLDRHGQARDVTIFHFVTDDDADISFLAYVVGKVDQIREDLGSVGEIFDAAFERRFVQGESELAVRQELDASVKWAKGRASFEADDATSTADTTGEDEVRRLAALRDELDLSPATLASTLSAALRISPPGTAMDGPDARGRFRIKAPLSPAWEQLVDDALRLDTTRGVRGALPALVFDPEFFMDASRGRPVFRPKKDTALIHIGHPLYERALTQFAQLRYPGSGDQRPGRWTVRRGDVPEGCDAVVHLTVEELAVNELRETFHHWVRTIRLPVKNGRLGEPLPHIPAARLASSGASSSFVDDTDTPRLIWEDVEPDIKAFVSGWAGGLTKQLRAALDVERERAMKDEQERFRSRQAELSDMIVAQTLGSMEREVERLHARLHDAKNQRLLFRVQEEAEIDDLKRSLEAKQDEIRRRKIHLEELRDQLTKERDRVLRGVVPKRFAMRGEAQAFPVTIEIVLGEALT